VHFGLGAETVAKVEITWPSGIVQTMENVAADRIVKVTEQAPSASSAKLQKLQMSRIHGPVNGD
jgi:hypothetical protein